MKGGIKASCVTVSSLRNIRERVTSQPNIKLKEFKALVKTQLKISINAHVCSHAKKKILKELMGEFKEEYAASHDYAQAVVDTNPGSTCFAKSSNENPEGKPLFIRFYMCLATCKKGWVEGCRKIIGLDGCFF